MSQQVKITRARLPGCTAARCISAMSRGRMGRGRPVWSTDPDEVVGWLCDGFRFRFNQRRSTRCRYLTCEDRDGAQHLRID